MSVSGRFRRSLAALVSFLAADEAGFIADQIHTLDSGRTAKLSLP